MLVSLQLLFVSLGLIGVAVLLAIILPVNLNFSASNIDTLIDDASRQRILRVEVVIADAINNALQEVSLAGNTTRGLGPPFSNIKAYQRAFTGFPLRDAPRIMSYAGRSVLCRFKNGDEVIAVGRDSVGVVQIHRSSNGVYQWEWGNVDHLENITESHMFVYNTSSFRRIPSAAVKPILLTSKGFANGILWNASLELRRYEQQQADRASSPTAAAAAASSSKRVYIDPWYVRLQVLGGQVGGMLYPLARMVFQNESSALPFEEREPVAFCTAFLGDSAFGTVLREYIFGSTSSISSSNNNNGGGGGGAINSSSTSEGVAFLLDSDNKVVAYSHGTNLDEEKVSAATAADIIAGKEPAASRVGKGTGCFLYNAAEKWIGCLKSPEQFSLLRAVRAGGWALENEDEWLVGSSGSKVDALGFRKMLVEGDGDISHIATSKAIQTGYCGFQLRLLLFIPQQKFTASVDEARDAAVGGSVAVTAGMLLLFFLVVMLVGRRVKTLTHKMVKPWTMAAAARKTNGSSSTGDDNSNNNIRPSSPLSGVDSPSGDAAGSSGDSGLYFPSFSSSQQSQSSGSRTDVEGEKSSSGSSWWCGGSFCAGDGDDTEEEDDWCPFLTRLSTMLHLEELELLEREFVEMGFFIEKLRGFVKPSALMAQLRRERKKTTTHAVATSVDHNNRRRENPTEAERDAAEEEQKVRDVSGVEFADRRAKKVLLDDTKDNNRRNEQEEDRAAAAAAASSAAKSAQPRSKRVSFAPTNHVSSFTTTSGEIVPKSQRTYANDGSTANMKFENQLFCVIWLDFPLIEKITAAILAGQFYPLQQQGKTSQPSSAESTPAGSQHSTGGSGSKSAVEGNGETAAASSSSRRNINDAFVDLIALTSAVAKFCHHLQSRPVTVIDFLGDSMVLVFRIKNPNARSRILAGVLRRVVRDAHAVHRKLLLRNEFETVFGGRRALTQYVHLQKTYANSNNNIQEEQNVDGGADDGNSNHKNTQKKLQWSTMSRKQQRALEEEVYKARCLHVVAGVCVGYLRADVRSEAAGRTPSSLSSSSSLPSSAAGSSDVLPHVVDGRNNSGGGGGGDSSSFFVDEPQQQLTFIGNAIGNARRIAQCLKENARASFLQPIEHQLFSCADAENEGNSTMQPKQSHLPSQQTSAESDSSSSSPVGLSSSSSSSTAGTVAGAPTANSAGDDDGDDDDTASTCSVVSVNGSTPTRADDATAQSPSNGSPSFSPRSQRRELVIQKLRRGVEMNIPYAIAMPARLTALLRHDDMLPVPFSEPSLVHLSGPMSEPERQLLDVRRRGEAADSSSQQQQQQVVLLSRIVETPDELRMLL